MNDDEQPAGGQAAGLNQAAIDWAWAQPVANNPGARVVLMALAHRVDETWEWTASQEEVAMEALIPARSVRRYLEQLEEGGFIARRRRFDDRGHRLPDLYRVNPAASLLANLDGRADAKGPDWPVANLASGSELAESLPANLDARASQETDLDGGQGDLLPDWPVGAGTETETRRSGPVANLATGQIGHAVVVSSSSSSKKKKPSTPKGGAGGKRTPSVDEEHPRFAEWYAVYPLRDKRPQAVKAFNKALAKVGDPQILIDGAKRYAEHDPRVKRGFIKGPSVWLNNDCWDDEIPPEPQRPTGEEGRPSNGSGSVVPPRGTRRRPFASKRETA